MDNEVNNNTAEENQLKLKVEVLAKYITNMLYCNYVITYLWFLLPIIQTVGTN